MANHLPRDKQIQILTMLVEGCSVRSASRMTGAHVGTILRLLARVGEGAWKVHDRVVRDVRTADVQLDEVWAFVGCKQRRLPVGEDSERGDNYTFVALDRDSKLAVTYRTGKRDGRTAGLFMADLRRRIAAGVRPQLSSDGFDAYPGAIETAFGADVDYGQVIKDFGVEDAGRGRYSPPKVFSTEVRAVMGRPDLRRICTSHVERSNLSVRMACRRLTRLTNGFSKKLRPLRAAVSLWFAYYNLCRPHQTLRVTPAMAAGVTDRVWSVGDLMDAALAARPA
mgnify:CR=1 FL=1